MALPSFRLIAHLDMDAFYASVELLRYPELRGQPVVIGGGRRHQPEEIVDPATGRVTRKFATLRGYAGRGVITTATYEARKFGLHSALGLMKAAALAPDTILLPTDFDAYRKYSRLFKAAVREIAPRIEDRGIDEIYVDLTDVQPPERRWRITSPARGRGLGRGPTPNPKSTRGGAPAMSPRRSRRPCATRRGYRVRLRSRPTSCWRRSPRSSTSRTGSRCCGRTTSQRGSGRCRRAGSMASGPRRARSSTGSASTRSARSRMPTSRGSSSISAATTARGCTRRRTAATTRDVVTESEPKSISRETTFERDLSARRDRDQLSQIFTDLCVQLAGDLQRKGYAGKTIGVKLRYDNFETVTRDHTIERATQDAQTIRRAAGACLKRVPLERRIRLLGVRIGALSPVSADAAASKHAEAPSLFD